MSLKDDVAIVSLHTSPAMAGLSRGDEEDPAGDVLFETHRTIPVLFVATIGLLSGESGNET